MSEAAEGGEGEFEEADDDESSSLSPAEKRALDAERRAEWRKARLRSLENVSSFAGLFYYQSLCDEKWAINFCCDLIKKNLEFLFERNMVIGKKENKKFTFPYKFAIISKMLFLVNDMVVIVKGET